MSQLSGPLGIPHRPFFPAYFLPAGPVLPASPWPGTGPARWRSLASHPTHNARVGRGPRLPPVGSCLCCLSPIDCIARLGFQPTHMLGSLEPWVGDCQAAVMMTAVAAMSAERPAMRFHTSSSRVVWPRHPSKKWPYGIRWLRQARRRWHRRVHVHDPIRLWPVHLTTLAT